MKKLLALILLFSSLVSLQAQDRGEDDLGAWAMIFTNNRKAKHTRRGTV